MQLEDGKTYISRKGTKHTVRRNNDTAADTDHKSFYPWWDGEECWTDEGGFYYTPEDDPQDLIAEVVAPEQADQYPVQEFTKILPDIRSLQDIEMKNLMPEPVERKIIQISATECKEEGYIDTTVVYALCNDGTVLKYGNHWLELKPIPQPEVKE